MQSPIVFRRFRGPIAFLLFTPWLSTPIVTSARISPRNGGPTRWQIFPPRAMPLLVAPSVFAGSPAVASTIAKFVN
jgi:hypothetical protein